MAKISLKDAGMVCSFMKSVSFGKLPSIPESHVNAILKRCNYRGFNNISARTPLAELLRKPENIQAEARLKERVASLRKHKQAPFNHFNFLG